MVSEAPKTGDDAAATPALPIKVARIIGRLNVGGPARQACFLHQSLGPQFRTILISGKLDVGEGDMSYLLQTESGVYWVGSMSRPVRFFSDFASFWKIFRILCTECPDIVHTHTAKAGAVGRVAALLAGVPHVVHTYHGNVFRGYFSPAVTRIYIWIERILNHFSERIIAISESQAKELISEYRVAAASKVRVVRTGFDLPPAPDEATRNEARCQLGIAEADFVVFWAGRFVPIKNIDLLVNVIEAGRKEAPGMKFLIAGDGPERAKFGRLKAADNFTLLGWQSDLSRYFAAADAVLLTSINEGTPAMLVEGMAARRPFVTTEVGGVGDLAAGPIIETKKGCKQAQNGLLVSPDADAEVILSCLKQLQRDPLVREAMGKAGRDFVLNRHSSERLLGDISSLYMELLKKK